MKYSNQHNKYGKYQCVLSGLITAAMLVVPMLAQATPDEASVEQEISDFQLMLLFHPDREVLLGEKNGSVFIYDGIKDKQVDMAMDQQFDRIESMMFTRVVITDESGNALRDPSTGEVLVQDDGC